MRAQTGAWKGAQTLGFMSAIIPISQLNPWPQDTKEEVGSNLRIRCSERACASSCQLLCVRKWGNWPDPGGALTELWELQSRLQPIISSDFRQETDFLALSAEREPWMPPK